MATSVQRTTPEWLFVHLQMITATWVGRPGRSSARRIRCGASDTPYSRPCKTHAARWALALPKVHRMHHLRSPKVPDAVYYQTFFAVARLRWVARTLDDLIPAADASFPFPTGRDSSLACGQYGCTTGDPRPHHWCIQPRNIPQFNVSITLSPDRSGADSTSDCTGYVPSSYIDTCGCIPKTTYQSRSW